ncbi:MAG: Anthranilate phosphoribosyltransferase [Alphaproteobacteria bacterium MarineAlpha9_Bin4]|nr:anthranilate phosphoribosyltransferase [Pelagibacterales bacterium]PPR27622.1 MAG: Anthranilate phosphoribosyltransferase [Alphaproteobacteria bacterium MarineAlpha9_Bin4]|tara:strand:- start:895 stop:1911 length:1017 start_codon:yes stop_codon:yes gene_type:complete
MNITNILHKVSNNIDLSSKEASYSFEQIISGKLTEIEKAGFLMALATKGPTINEIFEAAKILRKKSKKINAGRNILDTCGTGGDGKETLNVSTATAILASACGIKVAKHGNKAVSSKSGSSDVLTELGVNINANIITVKRNLNKLGICFLMAPLYHSAMKNVANVRNNLKVKTIFNILGPLLNPANADMQLIGVYDKNLILPIAECVKKLGVKKAWVVCGEDGVDEITISGITNVIELKNNKFKKFTINPEKLGLKKVSLKNIKGKNAKYNAKEILNLFQNKNFNLHFKEIVLLNTAACLVISNKTKNLKQGIILANNNIINGKALNKLNNLITLSNE